MNLEEYIKNLPPELQEKVRACDSAEELLALAKEAGASLPDEVLAAIAGGAGAEVGNCHEVTCQKCGSSNVDTKYFYDIIECTCRDCGFVWHIDLPS